MSRRGDRAREEASEPLFGEDWWTADQRLFEDSLARRETPRPPRRRAGKTANLRKQETAGARAPVQGMLPGFEDLPGADDEPIRADGPAALGPVAAGPVRGDRGPGQLLFGPGGPGGGEDRQPGGRAGRKRRPGEGFLAKAGRLGEARHWAEQIVLPEDVLLAPEPGVGQDEESPRQDPAWGLELLTAEDPEE